MLVMTKSLVDFHGSEWKSSWKTGSLERIGYLLHLTHKAPGLSCIEVECLLASRRKIGDRPPPFGEQVRINTFRDGESPQGDKKRRAPFGPRRISHFQRGSGSYGGMHLDRFEHAAMKQLSDRRDLLAR